MQQQLVLVGNRKLSDWSVDATALQFNIMVAVDMDVLLLFWKPGDHPVLRQIYLPNAGESGKSKACMASMPSSDGVC